MCSERATARDAWRHHSRLRIRRLMELRPLCCSEVPLSPRHRAYANYTLFTLIVMSAGCLCLIGPRPGPGGRCAALGASRIYMTFHWARAVTDICWAFLLLCKSEEDKRRQFVSLAVTCAYMHSAQAVRFNTGIHYCCVKLNTFEMFTWIVLLWTAKDNLCWHRHLTVRMQLQYDLQQSNIMSVPPSNNEYH